MLNIGSLVAKIKIDTSDVAVAESKVKKLGASSGQSFAKVDRGASRATSSFKSLAAGIALYLSFDAVRKTIDLADTMSLLDARIRNATSSTSEFNKTQKELIAISNASGTALGSVVSLFEGVKGSSSEIGKTNDDVLKLVDLLNKLGVISGASGEQMSNAMLQFSQAMAGGIVRAEEWNSILENTPAIARAIGAGLGKSVGEMRKLVNEGKVLSEDVFDSLLKQSDDINTRFENMPLTVGRATNQAMNEIGLYVAAINDEFKVTGFIADRIKALAEEIAFIRKGFEDREYLSALNEWNDLTIALEENQQKLNAALAEKGASIQNINRINALTQEQFELEEKLLETEKQLGRERKRMAGEPEQATGGEKATPKKASEIDKYSGQAALDARAKAYQDRLDQAREAAEEEIRIEQEKAERLAEIGQNALDNRAREYEKTLAYEQRLSEERMRIGQATLDARARQYEDEKQARISMQAETLSAMQTFSGEMLDLLQQSGKESTAISKALFFFNRALAVAEILINTERAAENVKGQLGIFGLPAAETIRATGYARAATVAGIAIAQTSGGGRRHGGYTYQDTMHKVAEAGPEVFTQGANKYLISDKGGQVTPLNDMMQSTAGVNVNVTMIESNEKAGQVTQTQAGNNVEIKAFVSLIRSTVAGDIARGGNQISRSLNSVGLKRQGVVSG